VAKQESFLVDKHNRLLDGEAVRALTWGTRLAHDPKVVSAPHTKL